eukprot:g6728.t1
MISLSKQLGAASRRAVRNFSVWLSLAAAVVALIAGVSDAFVAPPAASLPPSASSSAVHGGNTQPSSRSTASNGGCLVMNAEGGGTAPVWLSLAAAVVALIAGVSDAFVAPPAASLPPSASSSAVHGGNTQPSSRSTASNGGCLVMNAEGGGTAPAEPAKLAAVVYTYVDGMVDKRGPYRSDHLDLLKTMTEEGTCLLGGAFVEPCDGAVILFSSPDHAQQFVDKDPYNTGGLVTKYQIRDYMAVVGTMLKT